MNLLWFPVEALCLVYRAGGGWKAVEAGVVLLFPGLLSGVMSSVVELFCQGFQPLFSQPTP